MLYVRHTVGSRLFYETNEYDILPVNEGWEISFTIEGEAIESLLKFKDELNIFHMENVNEKIWYYSSEGNINYVADEHKMVITVDHKTVYPV